MQIDFRFKNYIKQIRPTLLTSEIRDWWDTYHYTSEFSGEKRKLNISYQHEQSHNIKLKTFQVDLFTLPFAVIKNFEDDDNSVRYILLCEDVISKFLFAVAITNKTANSIINAFSQCLIKIREKKQEINNIKANDQIIFISDFGKSVFHTFIYKHLTTILVTFEWLITSRNVQGVPQNMSDLVFGFLTP